MLLLMEKCMIYLWWSWLYFWVNWVNGCWWFVGKLFSWKCMKENCWLLKSSWKELYVSKNWFWEVLILDWFILIGIIWCNGKRLVILKIWFLDVIIFLVLFVIGLWGREFNCVENVFFGRLLVLVRLWDILFMWIMWILRLLLFLFMMIWEMKLLVDCYVLKILLRNWK